MLIFAYKIPCPNVIKIYEIIFTRFLPNLTISYAKRQFLLQQKKTYPVSL